MSFDRDAKYYHKTHVSYEQGETTLNNLKKAESLLYDYANSQTKGLAFLWLIVVGPTIASMTSDNGVLIVLLMILALLLMWFVLGADAEVMMLRQKAAEVCFSHDPEDESAFSSRFDAWNREVCSINDILVVSVFFVIAEIAVIKGELIPSGVGIVGYMACVLALPLSLFLLYGAIRKYKQWPLLFDAGLARAFFSDFTDTKSAMDSVYRDHPPTYLELRTHFLGNHQ